MSHSKDLRQLNIVHVTTVDIGGAYKAVQRLMHATESHLSLKSDILLRNKLNENNDGEVFLDTGLKSISSKAKNVVNMLWSEGEVSGDRLGSDITDHPLIKNADIIVIHWINSFLSMDNIEEVINLGKPVVIMLHDMWHFTGGCPCDGYCEKYSTGCHNCPLLSASKKSLSEYNLRRKTATYKGKKVTVIAPSNWILEHAHLSPVFKDQDMRKISNCIDNYFYSPVDKSKARETMEVPDDKPVVMFASVKGGNKNKNKGFNYLLDALEELDKDEVHLLILGDIDDESLARIRQPYTLYGFIRDERMMPIAYSAADVTVVPSLQESFSYSVCESMSCGTPVVAFPIGGILDQIEHKKNGYFAEFKDADDIAAGIRYCIEHNAELGENARAGAARFSYENIGKQWVELFEELTK